MSWSVGEHAGRDIGYGVPAICDHPDCTEAIDRGLGYVCGGAAYGGDYGCGRFFCEAHHLYTYLGDGEEDDDSSYEFYAEVCERCARDEPPFDPSPDTVEWLRWKLTDDSWAEWRHLHPDKVAQARERVAAMPS